MLNIDEMRHRAQTYRQMTRLISDPRAVELLNELAERYEALADRQEAYGEDKSKPEGFGQ